MNSKRVFMLAALLVTFPAAVMAAPAHPLEVAETTKTLLADVAYYLKYVLPGAAPCYAIFGGLQRVISGDDEMKRAKAERTLTNAKLGLVIGFVAAPLLAWLQTYYQ